jgi:hypothetical protein
VAPEALQLFPFKDEADIYSSLALKRHALGVMKMVGKVVSMLDDLPALLPVLKELGAKHVNYGVSEGHCEYITESPRITSNNTLIENQPPYHNVSI